MLKRCAAWMTEPPPLDHEAARNATPKRRHALLLNPFYPKDFHSSFGKHVLTPSQALLSVAGATPEHWEVRYWDENLLQGTAPADPLPEVVGLCVHLTSAPRAYELASWYRRRGTKVILGGLHVQACPEEAAPHADAISLGDGARTWPAILADVDAGRLRARYDGDYRMPYRDLPPPRRDILDRASFLTTASLVATRGCHHRCGFCYLSTDGLHIPCQRRDIADVVSEFVDTGEPYGVFVDNNLGTNRDYLRQLCRGLAPTDRIWSAAVSVDVADDADLVAEMGDAGCTGVFIGFESLTAANLSDAGKHVPAPEDYARRVELFHRHGIQVNGSFVLGFDHDGPDVFGRTVRWIEGARLECATFHILTPYPGTPLFRQMEAEGRLLHRDWVLYDTGHCVFRPKRMSPEELESGYGWCYERLFSPASIWKRRPATVGALPGYLAMSLLYKKCNWLWPWLIRTRMTHAAWSPVVEVARRRHVRGRGRAGERRGVGVPVRPGV